MSPVNADVILKDLLLEQSLELKAWLTCQADYMVTFSYNKQKTFIALQSNLQIIVDFIIYIINTESTCIHHF